MIRFAGRAGRAGVLAAALGTMLTSCVEYDHFTVGGVDAPYGGGASTAGVQVPLGAIVKAEIVAYTRGNASIPGYVRSSDRNVVEVRLAADESQTFVFLGVSPGTVTLEFIANDEVQLSTTARVFE